MMNSRERVLKTFQFETTDRPPFDLMEGCVWPELLNYFKNSFNLTTYNEVIEFLDPDFRWVFLNYTGPPADQEPLAEITEEKAQSKKVMEGPLSNADSESDIESHPWFNPSYLQPGDFASARARWPYKALVFCPGWMPLFWTACELFGVESAMVKMMTQPEIFKAVILRHHEICMDILRRGAKAANGICDLALLGDDFASQQNMMISPSLWRKWIKPYLAEQVQALRENNLLVLYHSCGAVRPILNDLIEIGVNGLLVFQTTARGMDVDSIAPEFGGKLAFYGGIDVQNLLSFGTPAEVETEVRKNVAAFSEYGGYIIANSHHTIPSINGENILAMCQAVKKRTYTSF